MSANWKMELAQTWEVAQIAPFLEGLGVDFVDEFISPLQASALPSNPYEGYTWEVLPNSRISPGVLHAYPTNIGSESVIWEEWFLLDGQFHHHILHNYEIDYATEHWKGVDDDHPAEVCDIQWHLFNNSNRTPHALQ
jgi:hypothetical protein